MRRFPFAGSASPLTGDDLHRLAVPFSRAVGHFFPGTTVTLLRLDGEEPSARGYGQVWREGVQGIRDRGRPALSADGKTLLLPVWREEEVVGAAVLGNSDLPFADMSTSWLLEVSRILSREFRLIKQWSMDVVTGLPNGQQLRDALAAALVGSGAEPAAPLNVVLIEIYPTKARDGEQALAQSARAAAFLDGLVGGVAPLYVCGGGVFGAIWDRIDTDQVLKMGEALLRRQKRENFARAHIGIATLAPDEAGAAVALPTATALLDQAWEALHAARRRGPHALCTYAALSRAQDHPFGPPPAEVMAGLRRLWRGSGRFALVLLREEAVADGGGFSRRIASLVGPSVPLVPAGDGEIYAVLADADRAQALAWAGAVRERAASVNGAGVAAGIALYPCGRFAKSTLAVNARKALRHAAFFEDEPVAVFDAVSLNISGDVYYNDGDLARAVREYRQGLALDADNVNLLNSLGVVYVQMNRYRAAIPLFEKAARLDRADFMAPFNLAFAYLEQGRVKASVEAFEKALAIDGGHPDVLLQLGRLYCGQERFGEAAALLERLAGVDDAALGGGKAGVQLALGEAYRGLGRNRDAIACLERAVRLNPRDGGALSLLGVLYAEEKQGDEIALSFCRQAVELDDRRWQSWFQLGMVQWRQGDRPAAWLSLEQSLKLDRNNVAVLYRLGRVCEEEGQLRRARRLFARVLRLRPEHGKAALALARTGGAVAGRAGR